LAATIAARRPGNRPIARITPSGKPKTAAMAAAEMLIASDRAMMCHNSGVASASPIVAIFVKAG
jgi:hypothetical protein